MFLYPPSIVPIPDTIIQDHDLTWKTVNGEHSGKRRLWHDLSIDFEMILSISSASYVECLSEFTPRQGLYRSIEEKIIIKSSISLGQTNNKTAVITSAGIH